LIGLEFDVSGDVGLAELLIGEAVKSTAWAVDVGLGVWSEDGDSIPSGEGMGLMVSSLRNDACGRTRGLASMESNSVESSNKICFISTILSPLSPASRCDLLLLYEDVDERLIVGTSIASQVSEPLFSPIA
jgi:hypothetical protein